MDFTAANAEQTTVIGTATNPTFNGLLSVPSATATFDVRPYNSYYLRIRSVPQAPNTQISQVQVNMFWYSSADGNNASTLFQDGYNYIGNHIAGTITYGGYSALYVQDAMHGPFMRAEISVPANGGADVSSLSYTLIGTTRLISRPYVRNYDDAQASPPPYSSPVLLRSTGSVPAGGLVQLPVRLGVGRTYVRATAGAVALAYNWFTSPAGGFLFANNALAINGVIEREMVLEKESALLQIGNAGGAPSNYNVIMIQQAETV